MKWKQTIILIMALIMIAEASAYEYKMCSSDKEMSENCTMKTPELTGCATYDYSIYNATSGEEVDTGTLIDYPNPIPNLYQFNFTQPEGDYIVKLCDGSTREVASRPKRDYMVIAAIIIIPMLFGLFLILAANGLGDDHVVLRLFLFLLSPIMFIVSLHFGVAALIEFYNFESLQNIIGDTVYWFGLVFGVIVVYFIIYLFIKMVRNIAEEKKEKLEG